MKSSQIAILLTFALVVLAGCRKAKDETPPTVTITAPSNLSNHNVFDVFTVVANVADDSNLEQVTVEIQNDQFITVLSRLNVPVSSNNTTITRAISLHDIHMESGRYYVKVTAFDGVNEGSDYVEINVTGVPLSIEDMFIVSTPNPGTQEWYSTDGSSVTLHHTFDSEYGGAAVNSYYQNLVTMGTFNDGLVAYHTDIIDTIWFRENPGNPPQAYYHKLFTGPTGQLIVSTTTGRTYTYGQSGTVGGSVISPLDHQPDDVYFWSDKIIVEQVHEVTDTRQMGIYYANSGAFDQSIGHANDLVSWEVRTDNELFVLSNSPSGQGKMEIYNYSGNSFWEPHAIPAGSIYDSYGISGDKLILAHDLGLYTYTYSTNSLIQVESGHTFTQLEYDKVNNVLWCVEGNELYAYDLLGNQLGYLSTSSNIERVLILYNK